MLSRKKLWTRPWKAHWRHQSIQCCRLVMAKESSPMMKPHTGDASSLQWQEVSRKKGAEQVVVIWDSVVLVWLVWFVSKRFVKDIIKWLDYQSNISKSLIIKGLDNQAQLSEYLCLIIKGFDKQAQDSNNQINQSWKKNLMCLWFSAWWRKRR